MILEPKLNQSFLIQEQHFLGGHFIFNMSLTIKDSYILSNDESAIYCYNFILPPIIMRFNACKTQ